MRKADLTTRAVAGFVDLLIVIGLARFPDVIGFLAASGYILIRDGLFAGRSVGKKLIGVAVSGEEEFGQSASYRESIIRNVPFAAAYILFLIPYAGWVLSPAALVIEWLVALGDDRGMRIGDMLARTWVVQPVSGKNTRPAEQRSQPSDLPSETANTQEPIATTNNRQTSSDLPEQKQNI